MRWPSALVWIFPASRSLQLSPPSVPTDSALRGSRRPEQVLFTASALHKRLGGRAILSGVSLVANRGEVIGVVGPNGSGKSTLLAILAGALRPDSGRVDSRPGTRISFLAQGFSGDASEPVSALFPQAFASQSANDRLSELAQRLSDDASSELEAEYDELLGALSAAPTLGDIQSLRATLGLRQIPQKTPAGQLSGGELTKLGLIETLASQPSVLLLDEPTNHLDLRGIAWLEEYLRRFDGAAIIVSHDRALLDACATSIFELDPRTGTGESFAGDYSAYADEKARREEDLWRRYELQQREERQLKRTISAIESRGRNIENRTIDFYFRKRAAKVARRAVTLKARLEREQAGSEHLERPQKAAQGFFGGFRAADTGASRVLTAERASLGFPGQNLLEDLSFVVDRGERVVITGPNGCGKTTLFRAIQGEHKLSSGRIAVNPSLKLGYLAQQDDPAADEAESALTPIESLRRVAPMSETDAYNFLHRFVMGHDQLRTPIAQLSYGERRRLALARLVATGLGLLLLDEPSNHLDLPSREAFEMAFDSFEGAALVITHDRYFIERFADRVIEL